MGSDDDMMDETKEEQDMTVDEIRKEPENSAKIPRCKKCRRMCFNHDGPTGVDKCKLDAVEDSELKDEDEKNHKIREKLRTKKPLKRKSSTDLSEDNDHKKKKDFSNEKDEEKERLLEILKKKQEETEKIKKQISREEEEQANLFKGGKPRADHRERSQSKSKSRNYQSSRSHQNDDWRGDDRRYVRRDDRR